MRKHIENGFYIDLSAAWPDADSVTLAFYERGWHGINVEPNPALYDKLRQQRARDINLQFGLVNALYSHSASDGTYKKKLLSKNEVQSQWLQTHSWANMAHRLFGMIRGLRQDRYFDT